MWHRYFWNAHMFRLMIGLMWDMQGCTKGQKWTNKKGVRGEFQVLVFLWCKLKVSCRVLFFRLLIFIQQFSAAASAFCLQPPTETSWENYCFVGTFYLFASRSWTDGTWLVVWQHRSAKPVKCRTALCDSKMMEFVDALLQGSTSDSCMWARTLKYLVFLISLKPNIFLVHRWDTQVKILVLQKKTSKWNGYFVTVM